MVGLFLIKSGASCKRLIYGGGSRNTGPYAHRRIAAVVRRELSTNVVRPPARPRSLAVLAALVHAFCLRSRSGPALWYADSLNRSARPPFVMAGVLAAGIALCGAHPI